MSPEGTHLGPVMGRDRDSMSNFVSRQAARRHGTRGSFKIVPEHKPKSMACLQIGVKALKMDLMPLCENI